MRTLGAIRPRKKFDNIFSRLDTIHEHDRRTDRWIPADSKDRGKNGSVGIENTCFQNSYGSYIMTVIAASDSALANITDNINATS